MQKIIATIFFLTTMLITFNAWSTNDKPSAKRAIDPISLFPKELQAIVTKPIYKQGKWGFLIKDLTNGKVIFSLHADTLFLPASVTKLFTVAALLDEYGYDYRFKTPVYAFGKIKNGVLNGNLILVGQGDLTLGGRDTQEGKVAYEDLDHINANGVPGSTLTTQDPLQGIKKLATQIKMAGIHVVNGRVLIDDRLFATTTRRGIKISSVMVNDNLFDITVKPTRIGKIAHLTWRPQASGYTVVNQVKTAKSGNPSALSISVNAAGDKITVMGTIAIDKTTILNVVPIQNPMRFLQAAFTDALHAAGVKIEPGKHNGRSLPDKHEYAQHEPIAELISLPLSEYAKLILKVSHNVGADWVPILLSLRHGTASFEEGMPYIGKFITQKVGVNWRNFVLEDAAGGGENRLTLNAVVDLLAYLYAVHEDDFKTFEATLPVYGVDGSLAFVGKNSKAKGKIFAKTGTNIIYDMANQRLVLATNAFAGYLNGLDGHLYAFITIVNDANTQKITDVFGVYADFAKMLDIMYQASAPEEQQISDQLTYFRQSRNTL